jgi:signal transduction histidine kinase
MTSLRFDDSLETVLAADMATPLGARAAWRQLVDLIGRGRVEPRADLMATLETIRDRVDVDVRAASARALEYARPPAALARLLVTDVAAVAEPILRGARLDAQAWIDLLPLLGPRARGILRHRRDLEPAVMHALDGFAAADFVLQHDGPKASAASAVEQPVATPPNAPYAPSSFVSVAEAARGLPAVARALRGASPARDGEPAASGTFQIADLVERIAAYQRHRQENPDALPVSRSTPHDGFRFETDSAGVMRWVDGVDRGPLIGLSLDMASMAGEARVDGVAAGAFRRRSPFSNARLVVAGNSAAGGDWRISAVPLFDPDTGRFIGYRGTARRPRPDEQAAPTPKPDLAPDSLRQLVHELRTPTTAIAGFAEMIEGEMLGPVAQPYRDRAALIRDHARDLLAAIDDLDLAARLEARTLDLREGSVVLAPLLDRIVADLEPLSSLRGTLVELDPGMADITVASDERATERLLGRLLAALVAAGSRDERIMVVAVREDEMVSIAFDRPAALAGRDGADLLAIDAEQEAEGEGAPLLGTGFALRLVRNLATELGGSFAMTANHLTLRLPAFVTSNMGQASIN